MTATLTSLLLLLSAAVMTRPAAGVDFTPSIPVEGKPNGLRYNPHNVKPDVQLIMTIDIHCPDSDDEFAILKDVQAHYGNDKLDFVLQFMPLPYHRFSFTATQGMYTVLNSSASNNVFSYIEESLRDWEYYVYGVSSMTVTEVTGVIADMAVRTTGIDSQYFLQNISLYASKARIDWKYSALKGVANTPAFYLNGVDIGSSGKTPSYDDWIKFLDPIILQGAGIGRL